MQGESVRRIVCTDVSYIEYNLILFYISKNGCYQLEDGWRPFWDNFWNESLYSKNVMSRAKPVVPVRHFHQKIRENSAVSFHSGLRVPSLEVMNCRGIRGGFFPREDWFVLDES